MSTSNEEFQSKMLKHQIELLQLSAATADKLIEILKFSEPKLRDRLSKEIKTIAGKGFDGEKISQIKKIKSIEKIVNQLRSSTYDELGNELETNLKKLIKLEPAIIAEIASSSLVVNVDFNYPDVRRLNTIVNKNPFLGKTLKEWTKKIEKDDIERILDNIKIGMIQGESVDQIMARILGKESFNGTDGTTELSRTSAATLARTATNFFGNEARDAFFNDNADIITEQVFVATLDSRTSAICRSLDGKRFPLGKGPKPPLHHNCRSVRVAVFDGEIIGDRPMKPFTEKQLLQEYAAKNDLQGINSRDDIPYGSKTKFDSFARGRVRELTGRVPAKTTYSEFLAAQTQQFQEEVLGKTKAKLFNKGKLSLEKFVNFTGKELTLSELARKYKGAFLKAGLDPKEYL